MGDKLAKQEYVVSHDANHFPTTTWNMVRAAKDRANPEFVAATNSFVTAYWRPVFYFLRARGLPHDRAEDVTQSFFLEFLRRDWITRADRQRGRFRTFLLTVLVRFLADQHGKRTPKQDQFEQKLVVISSLVDEEELQFTPPTDESPEYIFMKQWALAVVASVCRQLERWCNDRGRDEWYGVFSAAHFPSNDARPTQQELAVRLGISRDQVRYALEQTNLKFRELLRAEVAQQVGSDDEIEAEIRELELLISG